MKRTSGIIEFWNNIPDPKNKISFLLDGSPVTRIRNSRDEWRPNEQKQLADEQKRQNTRRKASRSSTRNSTSNPSQQRYIIRSGSRLRIRYNNLSKRDKQSLLSCHKKRIAGSNEHIPEPIMDDDERTLLKNLLHRLEIKVFPDSILVNYSPEGSQAVTETAKAIILQAP